MAIRALIFDFDGTLLDTESPHMVAWQAIFEQHQVTLSLDLWYQHIGQAAGSFDVHAHLEALVKRPMNRDEVRARYRTRFMELLALERLRDGVETWLAEAGRLGLDLAIASGSPRAWVAGHLTELGLTDQFKALRCLDDVVHSKPSPEVYLAALDCLGLQPDEAIAIEDTPNGSRAAKAAGLYTIAVPNAVTRHLQFEQADLVLESLADLALPDALEIATRRPTARFMP
jgi:HAD superfamily hydrolase (TIGR01509 family)